MKSRFLGLCVPHTCLVGLAPMQLPENNTVCVNTLGGYTYPCNTGQGLLGMTVHAGQILALAFRETSCHNYMS